MAKTNKIIFDFPDNMSQEMRDKIKAKVLEPFAGIEQTDNNFNKFIEQYKVAIDAVEHLLLLAKQIKSVDQKQGLEFKQKSANFNKVMISLNKQFKETVLRNE